MGLLKHLVLVPLPLRECGLRRCFATGEVVRHHCAPGLASHFTKILHVKLRRKTEPRDQSERYRGE